MDKDSRNLTELKKDILSAFSTDTNKLCRWFAVLLFGIYLLSGIYIVKINEVGLVRRFGKLIRENVESGIHYRMPWPIDEVDKVRIKEIMRTELSFWSDKIDKDTLPSYCVTGDKNIVHLKMVVNYQIKEPKSFLYEIYNSKKILENSMYSAMVDAIAKVNVDDILTTAKHRFQQDTMRLCQERLNFLGTGLEIKSVELKNIEPPSEVLPMFKDVVNAREDASTMIHDAESYSNKIIPNAQAEAAKTISQAQAYKIKKTAYAQGETNKFLKILEEYKKAKDITEFRLHVETLEKVMPKAKKYITGSDTKGKEIANTKFFINSEKR